MSASECECASTRSKGVHEGFDNKKGRGKEKIKTSVASKQQKEEKSQRDNRSKRTGQKG